MQYDLHPIWNAVLDVWQEVYKICQRHNLRVYVAWGTEIGVIRHKGFIPWDDDFDVIMPRKDYNKFIEISAQELPSHLKWHSIENDPNHKLMFGKVQDERKVLVEEVRRESRLPLAQGIFIDVFPMDGLPSSYLGILIWMIRKSIMRRGYVKGTKKLSIANVHWWLLAKLLKLDKESDISWRIRLQKWLSKYDFDTSRFVSWTLANDRFPRFIFDHDWFNGCRMLPFEGIYVPVAKEAEKHLSCVYGDYMRLPPEEKRVPTHQIAMQ